MVFVIVLKKIILRFGEQIKCSLLDFESLRLYVVPTMKIGFINIIQEKITKNTAKFAL